MARGCVGGADLIVRAPGEDDEAKQGPNDGESRRLIYDSVNRRILVVESIN